MYVIRFVSIPLTYIQTHIVGGFSIQLFTNRSEINGLLNGMTIETVKYKRLKIIFTIIAAYHLQLSPTRVLTWMWISPHLHIMRNWPLEICNYFERIHCLGYCCRSKSIMQLHSAIWKLDTTPNSLSLRST